MKMIGILTAAVAALNFTMASFAESEGQIVDVVATGYGATVREATKAALRSAVEAVVGTMVDATTLVENDKLIEEEILSYSAGMIASTKIIGEPKKSSDGIYSVKVKASVKKGSLQEKLRATSPANVALDGADLFARMTSAKDNLADAEAMIKSVLAKHIDCVIAEPIPGKVGKSPIDIDPKTGEVFVNVRVRIDQAKYTRFANEVVEKITPMATKKVETNARGIYSSEKYDPNKRFAISVGGDDERFCQFYLMKNSKTGSVTAFQLESNVLNQILACLKAGPLGIEVTLYDVQGGEIARLHDALSKYQIGTCNSSISIFTSHRGRKTSGSGGIMPFLSGWILQYSGYLRADKMQHEGTYKISLGKFSPEELKSVGKLEINVGHIKNNQFIK